jgi:hypothetical protein
MAELTVLPTIVNDRVVGIAAADCAPSVVSRLWKVFNYMKIRIIFGKRWLADTDKFLVIDWRNLDTFDTIGSTGKNPLDKNDPFCLVRSDGLNRPHRPVWKGF